MEDISNKGNNTQGIATDKPTPDQTGTPTDKPIARAKLDTGDKGGNMGHNDKSSLSKFLYGVRNYVAAGLTIVGIVWGGQKVVEKAAEMPAPKIGGGKANSGQVISTDDSLATVKADSVNKTIMDSLNLEYDNENKLWQRSGNNYPKTVYKPPVLENVGGSDEKRKGIDKPTEHVTPGEKPFPLSDTQKKELEKANREYR